MRLASGACGSGIRLVYASSAATYGDGAQAMPTTQTALETLRPLNIYGYSKQLFDLQAQRQGGLERIVGLKYFNVFGPNEAHKGDMRSLVAQGLPGRSRRRRCGSSSPIARTSQTASSAATSST